MITKTLSYFIFLSFFALVSFSSAREANCRRSGIKGHVYLVSGNRMPSPDQPSAKPKGLQTTLYIYELTNMSQVTREGSSAFYKSISSRLVKEVVTKEDGSYSIKLPPGKYSLFVKKDNLYYSNLFDGENNIHPVEVKKGKMTEEDFRADYGAVY